MSAVVRYEGKHLLVGDARIEVSLTAFDSPGLLRLLGDGRAGQPVRLLRFLLSDDAYFRVRGVLRDAEGDPSSNAWLMARTIIEGACPELLTLLWMRHNHPNELSFDFRRFLGIDLDEAWETVSPRKLACYAVALPAEGSLHRAVNPEWQWGLPEQLLAGIYDSLSFLRWEAAKLAGAKPGKAPAQMERPGVKPNRDVETLGAGDGFESIEAFDDWYAKRKARMKPAPE